MRRQSWSVGVFLAVTALIWGLRPWPNVAAQDSSPAADTAGGPASLDASEFPNLQAAFDAIPEEGGVVHIPPGTYPIQKTLVLSRSNVRIEGAGPATLLVNHTEGEPTLAIRPADRETNQRSRLWRVEVANLRLSGDPNAVDAKSTEPVSGDGLRAEGIQEIHLSAVSIDHHGKNGINLIDCYEDPRIHDCILTYNREAGLRIEAGHDIVVSANHFEENTDALLCVDSYNLCMTGNNLDDHLRHGVIIENTYGSVVSGNMIEECQGKAIILDRDCYGITLSSNVIAHEFSGGIELRDAWGCAVSANTFTIVANFGLRIGPDSGRITVTGNSFSDSWIGGQLRRTGNIAAPAGGIVLEDTQDIVVTGNGFTGLSGHAIEAIGECSGVLVSGNLMHDLGREDPAKTAPTNLESPQLQDRGNFAR